MKKKIVLFADYPSGYEIAKFLRNKNENILALVQVNQKRNTLNKNSFNKIKELFSKKKIPVLNWNGIDKEKKEYKFLKSLQADIFLFLNFPKIIKDNVIILAERCVNLHLSYLPYNRGKNPNIWSIIDNTPSGATIHEIDHGIDTGNIIVRSKIVPSYLDTGKSLWEKSSKEGVKIFKQNWKKIRSGSYKSYKQENKKSTLHYKKDLKKVDKIDLNKNYKAYKLINILRSRTFDDFPSAFIEVNKKKIFLRLKLSLK